MAFSDYKKEQERLKNRTDKEVFADMELSEHDLTVLKANTLDEKVSIPALVNLLLREKDGQVIKEENKEELLLRGYMTEKGNVSEEGKTFLELDETKKRLETLLND